MTFICLSTSSRFMMFSRFYNSIFKTSTKFVFESVCACSCCMKGDLYFASLVDFLCFHGVSLSNIFSLLILMWKKLMLPFYYQFLWFFKLLHRECDNHLTYPHSVVCTEVQNNSMVWFLSVSLFVYMHALKICDYIAGIYKSSAQHFYPSKHFPLH